MTKQSAFSGLKLSSQVGPDEGPVDQRLFGSRSPRSEFDDAATTKQRASAPTLSPNNAGASPRRRDLTPAPESALTSERKRAHTHELPDPRRRQRRQARGPASDTTEARRIERHSHDIFQDQIRWMNRLKLDLEEQYGPKVTGNAMVQLALDLFRDDFERHGEESNLIRVLVRGYRWRSGAQEEDGAEDGGGAE